MNNNYISTLGMSRLDWLRARQRGIGGSDAAALVLTPQEYKWSRPRKVYESKINPPPEVEKKNLACEVGHFLEPFVAMQFTEATGFRVHNVNRIILNPMYPFMFANIDRKLYGMNVGLEIKTTSAYNERLFTEEEYPIEYYIQMQHYMAVTGWEMWYLAALIGNHRFVWYEVPRNDDDIAEIVEIEENFWNEIVVPRNEKELEESWV